MATDQEQLVILVEARVRDLEKNMAKASGTTAKAYRQMSLGSRKATKQMEQDMLRSTSRINKALAASSARIGGYGKSVLAGFAGGLVAGGISGIVSRLGDVAHGIAEIGDEAKRAGVSVEAFQELRYVAEQNRIDVDAMVDGLKELSLRADEYLVTGNGSAAASFRRLGYSADELKEKLKDPSALFAEIIGRLQQLDKAAQIRIADEIFGGTGGEKFVQLIEQGERGIADTIQQARNLHLVMSQDLVDDAAELDRRFNTVANTVGTALKRAIVEATTALTNFIERFQPFLKQSTAGLESRLREIGAQKLALDNEIQRQQTMLDKGVAAPYDLSASIASQRQQIADLVQQESQILSILNMREPAEQPAATNSTTTFTSLPSNSAASVSAAQKQKQAVDDLISSLQFELDLVGKSALEQETMNALRRAGTAATSEQKRTITDLVASLHEQSAAFNNLQDAISITQDFAGQLVDDLWSGKSAAESLSDAVGDLTKMLLKMAVNAAIKSIFSSLFGGFAGGGFAGFADGGPVMLAGGGAVRGPGSSRSDSIPAMLSNGEFVVNAAATAKHRPLLDRINSGAAPLAFAAGGIVGGSTAPPGMPVVNVTIQKATTGEDRVTSKRNASGGIDVEAIVVGAVNTGFAKGRFDGIMKSTFGLQRRGV